MKLCVIPLFAMKLCLIILLAFFSGGLAIGQQKDADSLSHPLDQKQFAERSGPNIDSIQQSFYQQSDSVKNVYTSKFRKMDSALLRLEGKLDSIRFLQTSLANSTGDKIDTPQFRLQNKIDGLSINNKTSRLSHAIDSIKNLRHSTLMNLDKNMQAIKDKTLGKLNSLDLAPEVKSKLSMKMTFTLSRIRKC